MKPQTNGRIPVRPLTAKQAAFARWYCSAEVNMNGTEAARRAGYKGRDNTLATVATENLRKPAIRQEIDRRLEDATAGAAVTVQSVLIQLQVTYTKAFDDGKYGAAVRCLELQGRYLKMFSDRIEHVQSIEEVPTEQLVELIGEISRNGGINIQGLFNAVL